MSAESTVVYRCDGLACSATVETDDPFPETPDEWYCVTRPGTSEFYDLGSRLHFCSTKCLHEWTAFAMIEGRT